MSATLFVLGKGVLFNSGQVAPGAKVFFYLAGTSTKIAVYTTPALSTQLANPVPSDNNGKLPAIWINSSVGDIKYVVADQAESDPPASTIETVDNYPSQPGSSAPFYNTTSAETSAGVTPVDTGYPEGHVYRYGVNTTPGTTDMSTAINRAVSVMAQHTAGGQVTFPAETCRIASTINGAANVALVGQGGQASQILADNCDAITLGFTTYYGQTNLRDLYILGTNGATHVGINAPGTLDNAAQIYGVTLERCFIRGFNVGVHYRTVWHSRILNCRIEDVDRAVELTGQNVVQHVRGNTFIHGSGGGGAGSAIGITLDSFTYTSGAGQVPPEGEQITNNLIYGFATAVKVTLANYVNILANDLWGSVVGVDIVTANIGFNVCDNYLDMNTSSVVAGIYLRAVGTASTGKSNVKRNSLTGTTVTTGIGIKVNDTDNGGQGFVDIADNSISGFPGADIYVDHASNTWITGNRCDTSSATHSIYVPDVLSGTVFIRDNICAKDFSYTAAEAQAGELSIGPNIVNGTSYLNYPGVWISPAYSGGDYTASGSMTWTVGSGDVSTYEYELVQNRMTVNFALNSTTVGGSLSTTLKIAIPASKVASKQAYNACGYFNDNGTIRAASVSVAADGTTINIDRTDGSNMTAATDATYAKGSITFEVK